MRKTVAAVTGVLGLAAGWAVSAQESAKPTSPKAKSSHEAMAKGGGSEAATIKKALSAATGRRSPPRTPPSWTGPRRMARR